MKNKLLVKDWLAKVIFLLLPTLLVCYFILWTANQYYAIILHNQYLLQTVYVGLGMLASAIFYAFRLRFLPTFALLVLLFTIVYKTIDATAIGEFDSFFVSIQFLVFALLFSVGWFLGWGFTRIRIFPIIASALFFIACVELISKQNDMTVQSLLQAFVPILLYTFYIFYAVHLIYNNKDLAQNYWWFLIRRLGLFLLLCLVLLGGVLFTMQSEIKAKVAEYGGGGKEGKNSMLKKNKDGTFNLEDYSKLRGSLGRSNQLLFVAHIDNFFPDTDIPNPLYLTGFYYSKFDTATETFERDSVIPRSDLFLPNPAKIPLYFTKSDSAVLRDALSEKNKKTVEIEVYKTLLSPTEFVAPSTSFFIQPIAIEKSRRDQFKSAYRAKSLVSDLNSALFVYNAPNQPELKAFQEMRFEVLRKVNDYSGVPQDLMRYYTFMPRGGKFDRIAQLAREITQGKNTSMDKIIAVRDYFLSKDETGKPLFKYSDNPGIPDIPSASKLSYFLFENRKGYCAYYAGATLFMLRSLGIPSRITVGFLTMDRSGNNNRGWYWYYADQAHAWVQVYFPGYGWLDFDTTIGNEEAQQSPQPDGTPPMAPGNAILAMDGIITQVDTQRKMAQMSVGRMVFKDKEYAKFPAQDRALDLTVASIMKDSVELPIGLLKKGDSATAISFAEAFKQIPLDQSDATQLMAKFPSPAPIDELHVKSKAEDRKIDQAPKQEVKKPWGWQAWTMLLLGILLLLTLLFFALPWLYLQYLVLRKNRSHTARNRAYWTFKATQFYLHQLGKMRGSATAFRFAQQMDQQFDLQYTPFMHSYLQLKYSDQPIGNAEMQQVESYWPAFLAKIRKAVSSKERWKAFTKPLRTLAFIGMVQE